MYKTSDESYSNQQNILGIILISGQTFMISL